MSDQLYRINVAERYEAAYAEQLVDDGTLVPVEPDYEAIAKAVAPQVWASLSPSQQKMRTRDCKVYVDAFVDAALKRDERCG